MKFQLNKNEKKQVTSIEVAEEDVKVKMSICPECKNAVTVAIEHKMDAQSKRDFMKDVMKYNLDVKTISLEEYRNGNITLGCKENCSQKT